MNWLVNTHMRRFCWPKPVYQYIVANWDAIAAQDYQCTKRRVTMCRPSKMQRCHHTQGKQIESIHIKYMYNMLAPLKTYLLPPCSQNMYTYIYIYIYYYIMLCYIISYHISILYYIYIYMFIYMYNRYTQPHARDHLFGMSRVINCCPGGQESRSRAKRRGSLLRVFW